VIVVALVAVAFVLLAVIALWPRPLISRRENEHDPAWQPTGIRQIYAGHDQAQGERGLKAAARRDALVRRAAAIKSRPSVTAKVTPISARRVS